MKPRIVACVLCHTEKQREGQQRFATQVDLCTRCERLLVAWRYEPLTFPLTKGA